MVVCVSFSVEGIRMTRMRETTSFTQGGWNLSGNKRTADQSSSQTLDRQNLALSYSCMVRSVSAKVADAGKCWREGKEIKVLHKAGKHSQFAPPEGYRYDGIYKVKRYTLHLF